MEKVVVRISGEAYAKLEKTAYDKKISIDEAVDEACGGTLIESNKAEKDRLENPAQPLRPVESYPAQAGHAAHPLNTSHDGHPLDDGPVDANGNPYLDASGNRVDANGKRYYPKTVGGPASVVDDASKGKNAVTLSTPGTIGPVSAPFTVKVVFAKTPVSFDKSNVRVFNGTISAFEGDGVNYSFTLNPSGSGIVTAEIAGGAVADKDGNKNAASNKISVDNVA